MTARFDYFVVFAEMRTGSNFLEANLNNIDGLTCHGEAFNNAFIGYPNTDNILGVSQAERDADPAHLIATIRDNTSGLGGFRFFSDHDPRALDLILADPRCAKIILTRNPVDSYISLQIARATGQWKLTNVKHARREKIRFDPAAFEAHLARQQDFQIRLLHALQTSGQTAFYIAYEDVQDLDVMNGLAAFLGCEGRLAVLDDKLKRQNPAALEDKITNFDGMTEALSRLDRFNLTRTPNFEPRRGPQVPSYVAAPRAPLLYLPLPSGPNDAVQAWLSQLDDGASVVSGFTQKALRDWKASMVGHRSFTVVRHPLARAHAVFCDRILSTASQGFPEIRQILQKQHDVPLPDFDPFRDPDAGYDDVAHHTAFLAFLRFLKKNLAGQTSVRVDPAWASQQMLLQGMAEVGLPDMVVREHRLEDDLAILCAQIGRETMPAVTDITDPHAALLSRIVTVDIQIAARSAYQRDYIAFGFGNWAFVT